MVIAERFHFHGGRVCSRFKNGLVRSVNLETRRCGTVCCYAALSNETKATVKFVQKSREKGSLWES